MILNRARLSKAGPGLILVGVLVAAGCFRRAPAPAPAPAAAGVQVSSAPPASVVQQPLSAPVMLSDVPEPYVDLTMSNAPVRLILQKLAEIGKLDLIIPANLNRTLSVHYVHVPVSVALNDVLKRSGLRLGSGAAAPLPYDTVTVFYRLPANVDSLSVDAIMHRFGVSRAIAELIVKSRRPQW